MLRANISRMNCAQDLFSYVVSISSNEQYKADTCYGTSLSLDLPLSLFISIWCKSIINELTFSSRSTALLFFIDHLLPQRNLLVFVEWRTCHRKLLHLLFFYFYIICDLNSIYYVKYASCSGRFPCVDTCVCLKRPSIACKVDTRSYESISRFLRRTAQFQAADTYNR